MPGLLRGVGCTAAIFGSATAVTSRVSRRQPQRWSQQAAYYEPEPTAPGPAAAAPDLIQPQKTRILGS